MIIPTNFTGNHIKYSDKTVFTYKFKPFLQIHSAILLFGLAALFGKWIHLPPEIIVFGRVFFAGIAFGILFLLKKESPRIQSVKDFIILAFNGFLLAFHWYAFFRSIQLSTVAIGLLTYSSFPIFTVFLEPLFLKSKLKTKYIFLALLTFAGIYLIVPSFTMADHATQGVCWGLLSGLSFALITLINKLMIEKYSSRTISFYLDLFAGMALFPFLFTSGYTLTLENISLLVILGIACTALAHALFIESMKVIPARVAGLIASLEPLYGIAFAMILLNEMPSVKVILGGFLVLTAMLWGSVKSI